MNSTKNKIEDFRQYMRGAEFGRLIAILALAVVLRLIGLGSRDFWQDEVHNLLKSAQLGKVLFDGDMVSNHPPLFAILLALWRLLPFGDGEWYVRLLPVMLGVSGVAAIYVLGRVLFGGRAGLCAAFLLAFSPFHVLHSQDLKVYILLPFTATLTVTFLYLAMETNRRSHWIAYALSAGVACYSEYFVGPILLAINIWALASMKGPRDSRIRGWLLSNVAGALIFLPQLHILVANMGEVLVEPVSWWIPKPSIMTLAFYFKAVAFGYSDHEPYFKIAMVMMGVAILVGGLVGLRRKRPAVLLLGLWFVVPVAVVWAASIYLNQSVFLIRALLPFAIPLYALAGYALSMLKPLQVQILALALFAGIAWISLEDRYSDTYAKLEFPHRPGIHPPAEFKEATQYIVQHWREGDTVFTTGSASWLPCVWYGLKDRPYYFVAADTDFLKYLRSTTSNTTRRADFAGYYTQETIKTLAKGKNRVWFIFNDWERASLNENPMKAWLWMEANFQQLDHRIFRGLEVFVYEREINHTPITTVRRDRDDGVSALVTYQSGAEWEYLNTHPDTGLTPLPFLDRAGNLVVRFNKEPHPDADTINLANSSETRTVSFEVLNRSMFEVQCVVEFVPSDVMLDIAGFEDAAPESGTWAVRGAYTDPAAQLEYRLPVAMAHINGQGEYSLVHALGLTNANYVGLVRVFGSPGSISTRQGQAQLFAGDLDLMANVPRGDSTLTGWNWFVTPELKITKANTTVSLRASATGGADGQDARAGLAYLALWGAGKMDSQSDANRPTRPWPGATKIPNRRAKSWSATIDADLARVDIWVYELDVRGRAYRIFERF